MNPKQFSALRHAFLALWVRSELTGDPDTIFPVFLRVFASRSIEASSGLLLRAYAFQAQHSVNLTAAEEWSLWFAGANCGAYAHTPTSILSAYGSKEFMGELVHRVAATECAIPCPHGVPPLPASGATVLFLGVFCGEYETAAQSFDWIFQLHRVRPHAYRGGWPWFSAIRTAPRLFLDTAQEAKFAPAFRVMFPRLIHARQAAALSLVKEATRGP